MPQLGFGEQPVFLVVAVEAAASQVELVCARRDLFGVGSCFETPPPWPAAFIGAETFPVFTVFRPVVFMGKSYTAGSQGDAKNSSSACMRSALFTFLPTLSGSPNFTLLFQLLDDCDQQSGSELARHATGSFMISAKHERPATVALCPVEDLVRRLDAPPRQLVQVRAFRGDRGRSISS